MSLMRGEQSALSCVDSRRCGVTVRAGFVDAAANLEELRASSAEQLTIFLAIFYMYFLKLRFVFFLFTFVR